MQQIDFSQGSIRRRILAVATPMLIAQLLNLLYNIVDRIYIGKITGEGTLALASIGLCFPFVTLITAFANLFGLGGAPLCAMARGKGNREGAQGIMVNAGFMLLLSGAVLTVLGIAFHRPLLYLFGASEVTYPYASSYIVIYLIGTLCVMLSLGLNPYINCQGFARTGMLTVALGAAANIVLDPIMIYGLLGCPKLGVAGAAWATVLGQIASLALAAVFHFRLNRELPFRRKALRLRRSIVGEIYAIGVPAIIAQGAMSVMNYCVNLIFGSLDSSYVTAYGIVYKIQQFVLFAAFGLRDAITPIVSFSYGMQNAKRIREGVRCGLLYTSVLMLVCTAAVEILAQPLAGIFSLSAGTMGLCVTGLRVLAVSFVFAGANIAIQGVFQATEGGVQSLLVSLLRQLIFVLPAAWLFARLLPAGVWLAFPIAEVLTAVIAAVLLRHTAGKGRLSQQDHAASLSK